MKKSTSVSPISLTAALLLLPVLAHAHPGPPGHTHFSFAAGAAHPLSGIDHILAMVAVGLWAAQLGRRALWAVPAAFVGLMAVGGALGMSGAVHHLPFVEQGIMASVLILGLLIATAARLPLAASMAIVGMFAVFHGYAHGAEMPAAAGGYAYGAGFVIATAALHATGVAAGLLVGKLANQSWVRYAGGAIMACGCAMVLGWI